MLQRLATVLFLLLFVALPAFAKGRRVDLILDVEGGHRTGTTTSFTPNQVRYEPRFGNSAGVGGGVNWFFSDRVSFEAKVAGLISDLTVTSTGSDFVARVNLGSVQIYPITALVQWHPLEHGTIRPYVGAGAGHIILRNVRKASGGINGVSFHDPTGLVVDGGLEIRASKRFSLMADARYIPIESTGTAKFTGTQSSTRLHIKPLIVGFGVAYHY